MFALDLLILDTIKSGIAYVFTVKGFLLFAIITGFGTQLVAPVKNILQGNPNGDIQKEKR